MSFALVGFDEEAAMLTQAELDAFRARLMALITRLDQDRSQLKEEALQTMGGEASGGLSDVPLHLADLGSHDFEEGMTLSLLENEEQIIEEINAALARIDQGAYGHCEVCRREIPMERLHALPYARYCVPCAERQQGTPRS
jgi:RNA polymerase-binding protein DksA